MKHENNHSGRPELIRRRDFIVVLGGGATWPSVLRAQSAAPKLRVGMATVARDTVRPFEDRLKELGWIEGQSLIYDLVDLTGHGDPYGLGEAWRAIVARKPDVVVAVGGESALREAVAATRIIPIVMIAFDFDPVVLGYVTSLARPTGNVTGLVSQQIELTVKRLQYLRDLSPGSRAATMFWDATSADQWRVAANAADATGLQLAGVEFTALPYNYESAFASVVPEARKFLLVPTGPIFLNDRTRLAKLALDHGAASLFPFRAFVEAGGLFSYGVSNAALFRRAAEYVDRIARGAKPSELPIEQPTRFELVINQKTAKALGLIIPPTLLVQATEVIE